MPEPEHAAAESQERGSDGLVVGLVASAGGLDALSRLLRQIPVDSQLTFVIAQHLAPKVPSLLPELLGRVTTLTVRPAEHGRLVEPHHVYVITPGTQLEVRNGMLDVTASTDGRSTSVGDELLVSLAREYGSRVVGIVLSGAGQDGTRGLREVRAREGVAIAQLPETAEHPEMPRAAIGAGAADLALAPEDIAKHLVTLSKKRADAHSRTDLDREIEQLLPRICSILQRKTGHDFSRYKPGTLHRRTRRRIQALSLGNAAAYADHLEKSVNEPSLLLDELLIGVTRFFRDTEVFEALANVALKEISETTAADHPIRVWVPGCATGEEAYSLAMLFEELFERLGKARAVQIFATDIDTDSIRTARSGRYPAESLEAVSEERRRKFFVREGDGYCVVKSLREKCVFSIQDLVRDPPFSSLDLVSCRNLFIYLQPDLQAKVMPVFHYALKRGGFLLLGPAEGLVASMDLFEPVDRGKRIFRKRDVLGRPALNFSYRSVSALRAASGDVAAPRAFVPLGHKHEAAQTFERTLLDEYAPASALVNARGEIVYLAGNAGHFLRPSAGVPSHNIFDHVRGLLRRTLRAMLEQAASQRRKVVRERVVVEVNDTDSEHVRIAVWPLPGPDVGLFGVVIQALESGEATEVDTAALAPELPVMEQLERDLRATRAELQSTIEELESANEELQSSNEELQSSNEELHTSQEELQSVNEELEIVNHELQQKIIELNGANADLQNLFSATPVPTVFLDNQLRIAKFTPAAKQLFDFLDSDLGRPITQLAPRFIGLDVRTDLERVIADLKPLERQVLSADHERTFVVRAFPYRGLDAEVRGVVVTFVDVTALKQAEASARRLAETLRVSTDAITVWRLDQGIEFWNRGATDLYGYTAEEVEKRVPYELLQTQFSVPWVQIEATLHARGRWEGVLRHRTKDGRIVIVSAKMQLVRDEEGVTRVFESNRDITAATQIEESRAESERRFKRLFENSPLSVAIYDAVREGGMVRELRASAVNTPYSKLTNLQPNQLVGRTHREIFGAERGAQDAARADEVLRTGQAAVYEGYAEALDKWLLITMFQIGQEMLVLKMLDISDAKHFEEELRDNEARLRLANEAASIGAFDLEFESGAIRWSSEPHALLSAAAPISDVDQLLATMQADDAKQVAQSLAQARAPDGDGRVRCEFRVPMPDQQERWGLLIGQAARQEGDGSHRRRRLRGVVMDITQRKQAERAMLTSDRLEALGVLAGGIAHDFNNLLMGVFGYVSLAREATQEEEVRRDLDIALEAHDRATALSQQLLTFAKGGAPRREPGDLAKVVESSVRFALSGANVSPHFGFQNQLWPCAFDPHQLARVFENMALNARQAMPTGGDLEVTAQNVDLIQGNPLGLRAGQYVRVSLRDTGTGIAPKDLPRIFDPFYTTKQQGSGLGLATAYSIVRQHEGALDVESELGKGSVFHVYLPRTTKLVSVSAAAQDLPPRKYGLVLVMDDHELVRHSVEGILRGLGCEVAVASNGTETLALVSAEKARGRKFSAIFLDLTVPGGHGGREIVTPLKDLSPESALVAMSGYSDDPVIAHPQRYGFADSIAKPMLKAHLRAVLERVTKPDAQLPRD